MVGLINTLMRSIYNGPITPSLVLQMNTLKATKSLKGSEIKWSFTNPIIKFIPHSFDLVTSPSDAAASRAIDTSIIQISTEVMPVKSSQPNILTTKSLCGINFVITTNSMVDVSAEIMLKMSDYKGCNC